MTTVALVVSTHRSASQVRAREPPRARAASTGSSSSELDSPSMRPAQSTGDRPNAAVGDGATFRTTARRDARVYLPPCHFVVSRADATHRLATPRLLAHLDGMADATHRPASSRPLMPRRVGAGRNGVPRSTPCWLANSDPVPRAAPTELEAGHRPVLHRSDQDLGTVVTCVTSRAATG
jgi:hypothetical protein